MKIYAKKALLEQGMQENVVVTAENGVITAVEEGTAGDIACDLLTPGLFDVHTHGGQGYYVTDLRPEMQQKYLDDLLRHGITDVLLGTGSYSEYDGIIALCKSTMEAQEKGEKGGARIRGMHLEGPFLNPGKCGAMDPNKMPKAHIDNFEKIFSEAESMVRLVTVAPEVEGGMELVKALLAKGFKVQMGHTLATYEQANAAFAAGVTSLCHTFNAAPQVNHRAPGAVGAALCCDEAYCEVICDFVHLHPGAVKLIYKAKGADRMMIISDSAGPAGLPDGVYHLLEKHCENRDGACYLVGTNTLTGASVYIDQGVRNVMTLGVPEEEAYKMASRTPAMRLGMENLGVIRVGAESHLAAWDEAHECVFTVVGDEVKVHKGA